MGGVGEARRWLWPRRTASVVTGPFERVRERGSRGGGGEFGRVREFQGGGVARMEASGVSRWSGKQEVAGALGRGPRLGPSGEEEDDRGGSGDGLGRAAGPGGLPGERQVVLLSLSISVFIYLFCSVLF